MVKKISDVIPTVSRLPIKNPKTKCNIVQMVFPRRKYHKDVIQKIADRFSKMWKDDGYIGKTIKSWKSYCDGHISAAKQGKFKERHFHNWLRKIDFKYNSAFNFFIKIGRR